MNLIFFGTSEFAVPALEALTAAGWKPAVVVTLPDRLQGRGLLSLSSPVNIIARKHAIPVWQPEKLSDPEFFKKISGIDWDIGIIAAYGKLVPQKILEIPKRGFLNIHPSLLPEFRGPSPIQYAILEGKEKTGATIMLVDNEMDHGPVLMQEALALGAHDTAESLGKRLAQKGAELLSRVLPQWLDGSLLPREQDHARATVTKKIEKEDGHITWSEPAEHIERKIRAYVPWPGTYSLYQKNGALARLKIEEAELLLRADIKHPPGLVFEEGRDMMIAGNGGFFRITHVRPEGKKSMTGGEFLNGHRFVLGTALQ